ncbi:MAG TPA: hypothetical protein DCG57_17785 [Candidatus Riflebacteria bacterium]|jgi:hypothetical protein|nr:hypothetical protein [Candidatus Riflebacteria bacterium]
MSEAQMLEVRVSRKLLLVLTLVGLLFVFAAIEIGFLHVLLGSEFGQDKPILKWLFVVFSLLVGGAISINCFIYLIVPPVMLRVTRDKISFGTGFRYNLYDIPANLLTTVETVMQESALEVNGKKAIVEGGTSLQFKMVPEIPAQLATSAGIQYQGYCLTISSTYGDLASKDIVGPVKSILGKK